MSGLHAARRHARFVLLMLALAVAVCLGARPLGAAADPAAGSAVVGWLRPVPGAVVHPFEAPASVYAAGHRGADLTAAPGTAVRAANDGVVSFAGSVAGTLHVTVTHAGGLRTSYSFLASVAVRAGQTVVRGDVLGASGGTGPDHDGSVLHLGLRVGDTYVDPMQLFSIEDLTRIVRLVPAEEPHEQAWSRAQERRELQTSLRLPTPGASGEVGADADDCDTDLPLVGAAVDAVCDVGKWVGDRVGPTIDAGIAFLDSTTGVASETLDGLRASVRATARVMRTLSAAGASALARTPAGQLALDVLSIGRRFADTVSADCSDDAPRADGTGGSAHRVMVVAGINSAGDAWNRGATVALDVDALGYRRDEGEVRYFSYAGDGGSYDIDDTHQPLEVSARLLAEQLRAMQREQPGREVDLIAHSQGGLVVDVFLAHFYQAGDRSFPPLGNFVSLSSPHEGAPLATVGRQVRATAVGREVVGIVEGVSSLPPPSSPAVGDLAERSSVVDDVQRRGVPDHFDVTSIGATEDAVVPATNISLPGATETVAAVNDVNEHSAIVQAPEALRAVRAALEGRAPPCVGLATALRSAVAPVVISRIEHTIGDAASIAVGGSAR
jgi:murein DD-endopeptidase MepM/ murein hydrolase activator NlpD